VVSETAKFCGKCGEIIVHRKEDATWVAAPEPNSSPMRGASITLVVQNGDRYTITSQATLGRSIENDISLNDPQVSRKHAQVSKRGQDWTIEDLGSANKTFVNRSAIDGIVPLRNGDQVQIGPFVLGVEIEGGSIGEATLVSPPPARATPQQVVVPKPAPQPARAQSRPTPPAPPRPSSPKKPRSRFRTCLLWLVVMACVLLGTGGVGYYLYEYNPEVRRQMYKLAGQGIGTVTIYNLATIDADASVRIWDEEDQAFDSYWSATLAPDDISGVGGLVRAPVIVRIGIDGQEYSCKVDMKAVEAYKFYIADQGVLVLHDDLTPNSTADINVSTSPLCLP
jgi:hypothetical protein